MGFGPWSEYVLVRAGVTYEILLRVVVPGKPHLKLWIRDYPPVQQA